MECLSPYTLPNGADDVSQFIYNWPGQWMRYPFILSFIDSCENVKKNKKKPKY